MVSKPGTKDHMAKTKVIETNPAIRITAFRIITFTKTITNTEIKDSPTVDMPTMLVPTINSHKTTATVMSTTTLTASSRECKRHLSEKQKSLILQSFRDPTFWFNDHIVCSNFGFPFPPSPPFPPLPPMPFGSFFGGLRNTGGYGQGWGGGPQMQGENHGNGYSGDHDNQYGRRN